MKNQIQKLNNVPLPYRRDVDGLRAIAIFFVAAFHAFPKIFRGGFVGVDVFFVISGYLISSIILTGIDKGEFCFADFYARRIRRIFPALLLTMALVFGLGWFALMANEFEQVGTHLFAGAGFLSNFALWNEASYFDNAADFKPLLHLWSLAVEEQFYLIWPVLLFFAAKRKWNLSWLLAGVMSISFLINLFGVKNHPAATFYLPFARFWELGLGAALAVYHSRRQRNETGHTSNFFSGVSLLLVLLAIFMVDKTDLLPGFWALLPTLGAAGLIAASPQNWLNRKWLAHPVMVWVGRVSFPFYLLHWPMLSFLKIISPEPPTGEMRLAALALSLGLAAVVYRLVENPIRFGPRRKLKTVGLCAAMFMMALVGAVTSHKNGLSFRLPKPIRELANIRYVVDTGWRNHRCFSDAEDSAKIFQAECIDEKKPLIYLWGDSHGAALYPGLKVLQEFEDFGIAQFTASACAPLLGWKSLNRPNCEAINQENLERIRQLKPSVVLLHLDWLLPYYEIDKLTNTLQALQAFYRGQIVIVGPVPHWIFPLRDSLFAFSRQGLMRGELPSRMGFQLNPATEIIDKKLRNWSREWNVGYLSPLGVFCDGEGCLTRVGPLTEDFLSLDNGQHLTQSASRYLARALQNDLMGYLPLRTTK